MSNKNAFMKELIQKYSEDEKGGSATAEQIQ